MRFSLCATRVCLSLCLAGAFSALAQQEPTAPEQRIVSIKELIRQGSSSIPEFEKDLRLPDRDLRLQAVKAIVEIGTQHSLDPLVAATQDADPEIQIRATDGLVNFYLPGYVQSGLSGSLRRVGSGVKGRFTDTNTQVIDSTIPVRSNVIEALGRLAAGGSRMDSRANAARAIGVLRGRAAIPNLLQALRSKDNDVIYESLIALQKIRDPQAGPGAAFLLRDLDERVQMTALETTGLLQNREALPQVREVLQQARSEKVKAAALTALSMMPDPANRALFAQYYQDKNQALRIAAFEGYGRLKNADDREALKKAYEYEKKTGPRLALAFALVNLGQRQAVSDEDPLGLLLSQVGSRSYGQVAETYLQELAQDPQTRAALLPAASNAEKQQRIALASILASTGAQDVVPTLETLSRDPDTEVAQEGMRALRAVRDKP